MKSLTGVGWWEKGPELETGSLLCPGGDPELLREQNGLLRRIAQGSDGGSGTGNEEAEDSTIRG